MTDPIRLKELLIEALDSWESICEYQGFGSDVDKARIEEIRTELMYGIRSPD